MAYGAVYVLNGNGRGRRRRQQPRGPPTRPHSSSSPAAATASLRASVASRAALKAELAGAGWTVSVPMAESELLHLYRRRLTTTARTQVVQAVGATHVVGDDSLSPTCFRGGPLQSQMWKLAAQFSWVSESAHTPLVLFPDQLTRLRERVEWEFQHSALLQAVVVLVTVPREVVDQASDWASFASRVDSSLLEWGAGQAVAGALAFVEPLSLLRYPSWESMVPPSQWEEAPLPLKSVGVALRVVRSEAGLCPSFARVGEYPSWAALQARDREGLARLVVEVDLVQRPCSARTAVHSFGRRALSDLLAVSPPSAATLPSLPLQGVQLKGDMLRGFVDVPCEVAARLLRASGAVRGVFARPWLAAGEAFPFPPGLSATSHHIVWVKLTRFSDLIFTLLTEAQLSFDGLICPRSRGEVGIRLPVGSDLTKLQTLLAGVCNARVKVPRSEPQTRVRASGIPVTLMTTLEKVATALHPELKIIQQSVLRTTYDGLVVDLVLQGPPLSGDEWRLSGFGCKPVVVKRLTPRRATRPSQPLPAAARVPPPRVPLNATERLSWAAVARSGLSSGEAAMVVDSSGEHGKVASTSGYPPGTTATILMRFLPHPG